MRLLNIHTLEFREYHSDAPRYAIASHRWIAGSEATYKDVRRRRNTDQSGHRKVIAFATYVKEHIANVDWLWIDTCCIDEKSSQEVSEAINSMFRWYSNAEVCLAYLADVDSIDQFARSEWWTRGWTLQELLAPPAVVFLTKDWKICGNKGGDRCRVALDVGCPLEALIASLTNIPIHVLRDYEQSKGISVERKLDWAANRRTTREEDLSYCLFGIFGVAIGANYGEGRERARTRLLREISMNHEVTVFPDKSVPLLPPVMPGTLLRDERLDQTAVSRLMESLYFPQMDDRRESIQSAHEGTYRWALLSTGAANVRWDNLADWMSDPQPAHRVYWVNAKPGAGKSGLIRFLDEKLKPSQHMRPWADQMRVLRLKYYFWNPGNALQKSLAGVIRTILHQLFEELSGDLLPYVSRHKLQLARHVGRPEMTWSEIELRECFRKVMGSLVPAVKVFALIDGLDEVDGGDDSREDLVSFVQELASYSNVKLCVSSRRWPLFQDAFASCPQLRLEDLNAHDIEKYVRERLQSQDKFRQTPGLEVLVRQVIAKADGVFLWTRLVVKDLVRGIRDGDSLVMLKKKLSAVPGDLNEYFTQLMQSIEPHHRMEAGILLQLALHEEEWFVALNPLRLVDLLFISHAGTDYALSKHREEYIDLFNDADALMYALDSTLRRLSSRCKGLLQCNFHVPGASYRAVTALPATLVQPLHENKHMAFNFQIDFMHRSLRDFFLESGLQELLGETFDARNYLRNARLLLILMNMNASPEPKFDIGLASYFVCTLSIPSFRNDHKCAEFAAVFRPVVESVMRSNAGSSLEPYWYICKSLDTWNAERSTFLTLAIDFGLTAYVARNLTAEAVREKDGRPLLDYILRPRFGMGFDESEPSIGNHHPIPELVERVLSLGADPNQGDEGVSVWTLFLSFVADYGYECADGEAGETACLVSMEHMINGGASLSVARSALSSRLRSALAKDMSASQLAQHLSTESELVRNGTALQSGSRQSDPDEHTSQSAILTASVPLEDVLECMRPGFGEDIDPVKILASQRRLEMYRG